MTGTSPWNAAAVLTVADMAAAEAAAVAAGATGMTLMEAAGAAVAEAALARWQSRATAVLCGPGNNGGDGFVAARLLREAGWPVRVGLLGSLDRLAGDAALAAARWAGPVAPLGEEILAGDPLVVDALFGAGLDRPLDGPARQAIETVNQRRLDCVAVDVPSGVAGDTGQVLGAAPVARLTVTFFRCKPGHLLFPGRAHAGETVVADIGIPQRVLDDIAVRQFENQPSLWLDGFPWPAWKDNKYTRGHALVVAGRDMSGAARLAARAARRVGAGLVTVAAPPEVLALVAAEAPGLLVEPLGEAVFGNLLAQRRCNAVLVGPGGGLTAATRHYVLAALQAQKSCVLDADALGAFARQPDELFRAIRSPCLLTPHEGEFERLFPGLRQEAGKLARAREAAARSGATVLLKGADTVIAGPDGRALVNANAPPDLATGGSGDVLAGFALGLLAQGMTPFAAAGAAAWLHGAAAQRFGPGLIAEDIVEALPAALRNLRAMTGTPEPAVFLL